MQYFGLAGLLGVLSALVLVGALRMGWRLDWLLAWIKGNVLVLVLGLSALLGLAAWELAQFKPLETNATVATLTLQQTAPQRFQANLVADGQSRQIVLEGDQWELDVQLLRWEGLGHALGLTDGYRLSRLSGRYLTLEQQDSSRNLSVNLHATPAWRDLWQWLDRRDNPSLLVTDGFVIRFMPLVDGARFGLKIGSTGLTPVPLNQPALDALKGLE